MLPPDELEALMPEAVMLPDGAEMLTCPPVPPVFEADTLTEASSVREMLPREEEMEIDPPELAPAAEMVAFVALPQQ